MECPRGDKENVIGLDQPILRVDRCALNKGKQVPLYPFSGYIGSLYRLSTGNFVDLIDEDNTRLFYLAS